MNPAPSFALTALRRFRGGFSLALGFLSLVAVALAAEAPRKAFDLPAADAAQSLKTFTEQSGEQIVYPIERVRGIQTKAVKGAFTAREALDLMLAGTTLTAVQDRGSGALAVRRQGDPAPTSSGETDTQGRVVRLGTYEVLGTRIRQTEVAGPSPVSDYDADYIRSTGAFTLADFLNQIPQIYSGIASGRGSAPNELNPEFGQRTETSSPAFNLVLGSSAAPAAQTGVSGVSLRGLGSGSTLVLVDGRRAAQSGAGNRSTDTRQGFVDLNTIPLGMIERVEVITDGASAIYGADAVAGVINIILKKDYVGTEISGAAKFSERGGGRERNASIIQGFKFGKFQGSISLEYFDRQNLKASDRSFSREQNHTGIPVSTLTATGATGFGRDYRLNWGYPAVVQASGGVVAGTFDARPGVRVVLTPEGSTGTPTVAQFTSVTTPVPPATVVNASGQRRLNTAEFLDLLPKSKREGLSSNGNYRFNERLEAYGSFRTSKTRSWQSAQLSANTLTGGFGSAAVLPAALNPFNQNVSIGMMLPEFGPESQTVRTLADAATAGLRGSFGQTWEWDLGANWSEQKTRQITRTYNSAGFLSLLTNADPSRRFNPFIDYRAPGAPSQAALLETLALYPRLYTRSELQGLDFSANGDLFNVWGGPVRAAFGGSTNRSEVLNITSSYSVALIPVATETPVTGSQTSRAVFAEVLIPVVGKSNAKDFTRRLEFQAAGRTEEVGPFSVTVPKLGFSWVPVDSILLRGSWSEGFRAPFVTEYLVSQPNFNSSVNDPRRTPTATTGVVVSRGSNPNPGPEDSENTFAGLVYEPKFLKGFRFQADYYETTQTNVLQQLSAQTIVNNEALFPGRVTRAAPTAGDTALNQPGQITGVSITFVNFGRVVNRSADYSVEYTLPWQDLGNWRLMVSASQTLEATRQVAPGQPPVILEDDTSAPPKWKFNGSLFWRKGSWNASAFLWHLDGFTSNNAGNNLVANSSAVIYYPTPAVTKLDLRTSYEFKDGVWRGYGKGLRIGVGVSNVFDKEPPFSDTLWGFNAGLHSQLMLGRAYEFSFVLPL